MGNLTRLVVDLSGSGGSCVVILLTLCLMTVMYFSGKMIGASMVTSTAHLTAEEELYIRNNDFLEVSQTKNST